MKKSQAAMEFLMTYGWAILVVLVIIGTLAYFGVLNPCNILSYTSYYEDNCVEYNESIHDCDEWDEVHFPENKMICLSWHSKPNEEIYCNENPNDEERCVCLDNEILIELDIPNEYIISLDYGDILWDLQDFNFIKGSVDDINETTKFSIYNRTFKYSKVEIRIEEKIIRDNYTFQRVRSECNVKCEYGWKVKNEKRELIFAREIGDCKNYGRYCGQEKVVITSDKCLSARPKTEEEKLGQINVYCEDGGFGISTDDIPKIWGSFTKENCKVEVIQ